MSREVRRRLKRVESRPLSEEELQRKEDKRMDELVKQVKTQYPGEKALLAAIDRCRILEPSDTQADIEEFSENVSFIILEIRRIKAEAAQPSK